MMSKRLMAAAVLVLFSATVAPAQEAPAVARRRAFTAQTKPRVAVMKFENTNAEANAQGFGASVSAMLITFLKRQSQLVVVERQNLDVVLEEWKKRETGVAAIRTDVDPLQVAPVLDPTQAVPTPQPQLQLLASIEAILDGRVTVLGDCRPQAATNGAGQASTEDRCSVEIDARLISPEDAHIIAAGHQSGPRSTLRATVERLGVELEQGFLRPYYGNLSVSVEQPSNVRITLMPILSVNASDDEKPAIGLDRTATPQGPRVQYEKWVTVPNVANISSLLGGWYAVKLDRPGFESQAVEDTRIVLQDVPGQTPRLTQSNGSPLTPEQEAFVVQVVPFETRKWPADGRPVQLVKKGGSAVLRVRREYVDREFKDAQELPGLKTFLRAETRDARGDKPGSGPALLDINDRTDLESVNETSISGAGSSFNQQLQARLDDIDRCTFEPARPVFESFTGGRLLIEDYHRLAPGATRRLPVGSFRVSAVVPNYWVRTTSVFDVADKVENRVVQIELKRATGNVTVNRTDPPAPGSNIVFEGQETKFRLVVPLDFTGPKTIPEIPVDAYTVTTDLPGFNQWTGRFVLSMDRQTSKTDGAEAAKAEADAAGCVVKAQRMPAAQFAFDLKTQPWLAGRTDSMNRFKDRSLSVQRDVTAMLDEFIAAEEQRRSTGRQANGDAQSLLVGRATDVADGSDRLAFLRWYLGQTDLLYLDDADVKRVVRLPEVVKVIREYIDGGGAVYAFVSEPTDVAPLFGAPIPFDTKLASRKEMELRPGDVRQVTLDLKLESQLARTFLTLRPSKDAATSAWRVVSYRKKGRKEPAIIEKGEAASGGYVLVWLDSLGQLPAHEITVNALSAVEKRAVMWAQFLMYRRVGPNSPQRTDAQAKLDATFGASGEAKILSEVR